MEARFFANMEIDKDENIGMVFVMGLYEKIQKWLVNQAANDDKSKIALYRRAGQVGSKATFYRFVSGQSVVPGADKFMDWLENLGFQVAFPGEKLEQAPTKDDTNEICGRIFKALNSMGVEHSIIIAAQQAVLDNEGDAQRRVEVVRSREPRAVGE